MEHDWIKATFIPAVVAKVRDATNLTRHLQGGHLLRKTVWHPSLSNLAIIFIWIDKVHVVNDSQKIIWIFTIANSRNVDLTEKQHSRHQQFLRIPLSPLEASSRLPRSRDHLFSHLMSKASLPQGPDMWYLTFYENKVPIYQTTISNSLYFKISPSHFCTKLWSKTKHGATLFNVLPRAKTRLFELTGFTSIPSALNLDPKQRPLPVCKSIDNKKPGSHLLFLSVILKRTRTRWRRYGRVVRTRQIIRYRATRRPPFGDRK